MNFAIVGTGRMANEHGKAIKALGHNIAFLAKGSVIKKSETSFSSYSLTAMPLEELNNFMVKEIKENNYNAIIVAVTWTETEKIIEPLIKLGIPILIEKPVCLTSNRMKEIIVNNNTDHVMVAYNRRFYPFIEKIKQEIKSNILLSVEVNLPEKLNKYKEQGVQMLDEYPLLYSACHVMDLLIYLTGTQEITDGFRHSSLKHINAMFINDFGAIVHFQANFNTPSIPRVVFNFADKIIELEPIEQCYIIKNENIHDDIQSAKKVNGVKEGIYEQMEYFINKYVLKKDIEQIGCTMQEALKVIKLSEQLTRRN